MLIRNIEQILNEGKKYTVSTVSGAYFHPLSLNIGLARVESLGHLLRDTNNFGAGRSPSKLVLPQPKWPKTYKEH